MHVTINHTLNKINKLNNNIIISPETNQQQRVSL
jgi:hypothetical protein